MTGRSRTEPAGAAPGYDDTVGWVRIDGLIAPDEAGRLAAACLACADGLADPRAGDKPHGATRRLTGLEERVPATAAVAEAIGPVVDQSLGPRWTITEIGFRWPGPGSGGQQLHADDRPRTDPDLPCAGATAIVPLVDVTPDNGATRVVPGSHRRPDLQRRSQQIDHHPDEEYLTGPAGTGFVFSRHLLHAGSTNRSDRPRPVLQISYRAGP
ncbi:MAG: phytanoyl-CoA dioxygenase family protein [Acidimicrobiales bacterium]